MNELNEAAWLKWTEYRSKVHGKSPYKMEQAKKDKLCSYGDQQTQMAIIDAAIHKEWLDFFPLRPEKPMPGVVPKRTAEQQKAADFHFEYLKRESARNWDADIRANPIRAKLMLCDALNARYDVEPDQSSLALAEKREWLKERAGAFLREADPAAVLADFSLRRLVLIFWPNGGLARLRNLVDQRMAA